MITKSFQVKEILPNPFRRMEQYPLNGAKMEQLEESIKAVGFWEGISVRINAAGKPELAFGHHRLAVLRKLYPSTKTFDWIVRTLTDGEMIQWMSRENGESYKTDAAVLRETIRAAVEAHAAGKILAKEMPIPPHTKPNYIRYAPAFSSESSTNSDHLYPYTIEALAAFLGHSKSSGEAAKDYFRAAFGAVELIADGYLTEARIKDLPSFKLEEVVTAVKKQRDAAIAESRRLAVEAEARRQEAIRKAEELTKQQAAAEEKRKQMAELERLAAIKRAEEKVKRDAEEKVRREAEEKQRKIAAEQRAIAETKRKEEEARLAKIREAQRIEAEKQRAEAEKVRQIALAKAKKESDERKAEQMKKDAEAAKARAEADAKRKEEDARKAEAAAKQRTADEKVRQAQAQKKREEDEARQAEQRRVQQEAQAKKDAQAKADAEARAAQAKKDADAAAERKRAEIAKAEAAAKQKAAEAAKEQAAARAQVKATADRIAAEAKTMNRDDIRSRTADIADEEAFKVGRKAAARAPSTATVDADLVNRFINDMKAARAKASDVGSAGSAGLVSRNRIPKAVIATAKELVEAGYKDLSKKRHPDVVGGSKESMQLLNAAVAWLRAFVKDE